MAFKVPASKAAESRFEFELDGTNYSLPTLDCIALEVGVLFQQDKPLEALIAAADDEKTEKAIRKLHADQVGPLVEAWGEAGETELGE